MWTFLRNLAKRLTTYPTNEEVFWGQGLGSITRSGVRVTEQKALGIPAYWAAIKRISEDIGQLPFQVMLREERGSQKATGHYLYPILHDRPNNYQSSFTFRQTLQSYVLRWGNAYAEIVRNPTSGRVTGLYPIPSEAVSVEISKDKRNFRYVVTLSGGKTIVLDPENVLHIRGLGNGITGQSPVQLFRESLSITINAEQAGSSFFANMFRPAAVAKHPAVLKDEAYKRLRRHLETQASGSTNTGSLLILEEGMDIQQWSIPPSDAQFLESRKFQTREIARIFGIPPHLIQDLEQATFSNIEEQALEYVVYTLQPWLVNWEQECNYKLLSERERQLYFTHLNANGLLRGNTTARSAFYQSLFSMGALSPNDIREFEDLPPIEGGDQYLVQLNLTTLQALQESIQNPPELEAISSPVPVNDQTQEDEENTRKALIKMLKRNGIKYAYNHD